MSVNLYVSVEYVMKGASLKVQSITFTLRGSPPPPLHKHMIVLKSN